MRRELIFVLLAIMFIYYVSMISEYLNANNIPEKIFLDIVTGGIGAGNFSYWHVKYKGPLILELKSLNGDADIYISHGSSPTCEIEGNDMSSVSCGLDIVQIPSDYPRPIVVGIYGHWSYKVSVYSLEMYLNNEELLEYDQIHIGDKERGNNYMDMLYGFLKNNNFSINDIVY